MISNNYWLKCVACQIKSLLCKSSLLYELIDYRWLKEWHFVNWKWNFEVQYFTFTFNVSVLEIFLLFCFRSYFWPQNKSMMKWIGETASPTGSLRFCWKMSLWKMPMKLYLSTAAELVIQVPSSTPSMHSRVIWVAPIPCFPATCVLTIWRYVLMLKLSQRAQNFIVIIWVVMLQDVNMYFLILTVTCPLFFFRVTKELKRSVVSAATEKCGVIAEWPCAWVLKRKIWEHQFF